MAEPTSATEKPASVEATPAPAKSGRTVVKITALLFVVAVILAECLVAYLYLPSHAGSEAAAATPEGQASPSETNPEPERTPAKAEHGKPEPKGEQGAKEKEASKSENGKKHTAKGGSAKKGESVDSPEAGPDANGLVEVDLEQFTVTAHQPAAATTMRIDFRLFGMVQADNKEEFERLMRASYHRFREQVIVIVRSAEPSDLADAGLGLIKRQILEKTNILLGKPLLQAVVVSDFSYIEQ